MADESDAAPAAPPSIDAIAAEYKLTVDTPALTEPATPASTPAPAAQPQTPNVPDPITETDAFKQYMASQNSQNAELHTSLSSVNSALGELQRERELAAAAREEQELNALVDKVHAGLAGDDPSSVPKNLVKYAIADRYNSDPAFKAIVDGRDKAPEALSKAVDALLPEFRKDFSVRPDPQIAENQKAMSDGTRGSTAPVTEDTPESKMMQMGEAQFAQAWGRLRGGM